MQYTVERIRIDLQPVGFNEITKLAEQVESELRRIMRFRTDIVAADIYLRGEGRNPTEY